MNNNSLVRGFGSAFIEAIKAVARPLEFPGYGGGSYQGFSSLFNIQQYLGGVYANSHQNWATQVGDPSLSSLVMAASGWVGRRLPEATLQVVETDGEDNDEIIVDHPLVQLFARPNPYYDDACLWEHFAFSWILDGNVYWLLRRDSRGRVVEIWPLPHWLVYPRWRNTTDYLSAYEYTPNGQSILYAPQDIVHFRFGVNDPDNTRKGMSPLRSILREVFSDSELANYSAALIKNSGVPPLVVTTKEMSANLTQEDATRFQAGLQRRISGDQRGKVLFHTWPLEVQKLSFDPKEMDLRSLRFMSEERFCAVTGLNAIVLGFGVGAEKSIYNNVESAKRSATEEYLCPLWNRIAGTIEHQLLPMFEADTTQHVRFDTSTVVALQEKENEKHARVCADVAAGLVKVKDAQMMLGWPPDEEADYYLRPSTLVAVKSDGEVVGQVTPPAPMPPMPAEAEEDGEPEDDAETDAPETETESQDAEPVEPMKAMRKHSRTEIAIVGYAAGEMLKFREAIPDEDLAGIGRVGNAHVTLLEGITTKSADDVRVALGRAFEVKATYGRTDYVAHGTCDEVYIVIESPDLLSLHKMLKGSVKHARLTADYVPRVTLAYVKSGLGAKYAGASFLRGWVDKFNVLVFSAPNGERSQIPLGFQPVKANTNGTPSKAEVQAAIDFWRDAAPEAADLITATTINE